MSLSREHLESPLGSGGKRGPRGPYKKKNPPTGNKDRANKPGNSSKQAPKPTLTPNQLTANGFSKTAQSAYSLFKRGYSTEDTARRCGIAKIDAESYIARTLRLEAQFDEFRTALQKANSEQEKERVRRIFKARGIMIEP
jgi:hypothetical protein